MKSILLLLSLFVPLAAGQSGRQDVVASTSGSEGISVVRALQFDSVYLVCDPSKRTNSSNITWKYRPLPANIGSNLASTNITGTNKWTSVTNGANRNRVTPTPGVVVTQYPAAGQLFIDNLSTNLTGEYQCFMIVNGGPDIPLSNVYRLWVGENTVKSYTRSGTQWKSSIIPYEYSRDITDIQKKLFEDAFDILKVKTCLRFQHVPHGTWSGPSNGRLLIRKNPDQGNCIESTACYSANQPNELVLGEQCFKKKIVNREIMRVLCLDMELDRKDRSIFLEFDGTSENSCVIPGGQGSTYANAKARKFLYDYLSVTHPSCSPKYSCFKPKLPGVPKCGLDGFTPFDIAKINAAYKCKGCYAVHFKPILDIEGEDSPVLTDPQNKLGLCRKYKTTGDITIGTFDIVKQTCTLHYDHPDEDVSRLPGFTNDEKDKLETFEFLANPRGQGYEWIDVKCNDPRIPPNPIAGGHTKEGVYLYFCRTFIPGRGIVGGTVSALTCKTPYLNEDPNRESCFVWAYLDCIPDHPINVMLSNGSKSWGAMFGYVMGGILPVLAGLLGVLYWKGYLTSNRHPGSGRVVSFRAYPNKGKALPNPDADENLEYEPVDDVGSGNRYVSSAGPIASVRTFTGQGMSEGDNPLMRPGQVGPSGGTPGMNTSSHDSYISMRKDFDS